MEKYKDSKQFTVYLILVIFFTFGISVSTEKLLANWTEPAVDPPGGNLTGPIYNENIVTAPVVGYSLGVAGDLDVGGVISMNDKKIENLATIPVDDSDVVTKSYVDERAGGGCSEYVVHQGNCDVYCEEGELFIQGGCSSDFTYIDDWPIVSSQPVLSVELDPEDARLGWACSYQTRRDAYTGTDDWYGGYCMTAYVLCCK